MPIETASDVKGELLAMPNYIKKAAGELIGLEEVFDLLKGELSSIELYYRRLIVADVGDDGKPRFSNAEKRELEFQNRLKLNEEFQEKDKKLKSTLIKLKLGKVELEYFRNRFSSYKYFVKLIGIEEEKVVKQ